MDRVFVYWDNSNIFLEAQRLAAERELGPAARYRVRIHFENMLRLAHADRPMQRALAAGSVPPEMRQLWNRMEASGVEIFLFDRGDPGRGEQEMPDRVLQLRMLEDALDFNGDPGVAVLLTGDGAGYLDGAGFHSALERMHRRGWRVEILSWAHATNQRNAQMGGGERRIRSFGRFLRGGYVCGTLATRFRVSSSAGCGSARSVPPTCRPDTPLLLLGTTGAGAMVPLTGPARVV